MSAFKLLTNLFLKELLKKTRSGITSLKNLPILKVDAESQAGRLIELALQRGTDLNKVPESTLRYIFEQFRLGKAKTIPQALAKADIKTKADVLDLTGTKIKPGQTIIGGKGYDVDVGGIKGIEQRMDKIKVMSKKLAEMEEERLAIYGKKKPTETEAQIKSKLEGMNKKTVDRIRRKRYEAALKAEREKMAKDSDYIPEILDPDDFAYGGIAGMLGERTPMKKGNRALTNVQNEFLKLQLKNNPEFIAEYFPNIIDEGPVSKYETNVPYDTPGSRLNIKALRPE